MFWRFFARRLVLAALVLVGGCVAVPTQDLNNYREAFLEARNAGTVLYDDLSAVIVRQTGNTREDKSCTSVNGAPPLCFDPKTVLRGSEAPRDPAIQARIVALKTVATYNLALADLAEGKSETEIAGRIEELTGLVGDVVSLAPIPFGKLAAFASGPVVETFKQFVTRLERAQASAAIRQSILTESGTVDQIIDLLIADTGKMYDVYYIFQGDIAVHQPAAADRKREADRISKFHESLTAYVQLLKQSKQSLASLRKAAQEQTGSITNVRAVIVEATEIRRAAENFWNAVRELHQ